MSSWDEFCEKYGDRVREFPLRVILHAFYVFAGSYGREYERVQKAEEIMTEFEAGMAREEG